MNKSELIKRLSDKFLVDPVKANEFTDAVFNSIASSLKKGKNINIVRFGRFSHVIKNVSGEKVKEVSFSPVKKFAEEANYPYEHLPHVKIKSLDEGYIAEIGSPDSEYSEDNVILDFTGEFAEKELTAPFDAKITIEKEVSEKTEPPETYESKEEISDKKDNETQSGVLPDVSIIPKQTVFLDADKIEPEFQEKIDIIDLLEKSKSRESDEISENLVKLLEEREKILEDIERLEKDFFDDLDYEETKPGLYEAPLDNTPVFEEPFVFTEPLPESESRVFEELPGGEDIQVFDEHPSEEEKVQSEEIPAEDKTIFEELPLAEEKPLEEISGPAEETVKEPEDDKTISEIRESKSAPLSLQEIEERIKDLEHLVFEDTDKAIRSEPVEELTPQETETLKEETVQEKEIQSPEMRVFDKLTKEKESETSSRQILGDELKALHEDIEKEPSADSTIKYMDESGINKLEDAFEEKPVLKSEEKIKDNIQTEKIKDYSDVFTPVEHMQRFGSYPPMVIGDKPVDKKTIIKGFLFILLIIVALLVMISIYTKIGQKSQVPVKDTVTVSQNITEIKPDTSSASQDNTAQDNIAQDNTAVDIITENSISDNSKIVYTTDDAVFWQLPEGVIIQVANYSSLDEAQARVETLRQEQVNARVIPYETDNETTYYRVITGPYATLQEAKDAFADY